MTQENEQNQKSTEQAKRGRRAREERRREAPKLSGPSPRGSSSNPKSAQHELHQGGKSKHKPRLRKAGKYKRFYE